MFAFQILSIARPTFRYNKIIRKYNSYEKAREKYILRYYIPRKSIRDNRERFLESFVTREFIIINFINSFEIYARTKQKTRVIMLANDKNQTSKNYTPINLEGRNVEITRKVSSEERERVIASYVILSHDHPQISRAEGAFPSNNRHSARSQKNDFENHFTRHFSTNRSSRSNIA